MAVGELVMAICLGVGLAAACGFRVFLPLFVASLALQSGAIDPAMIPLSPGFAWVATPPAAVALGLATLLEIAGYYIPWLDNLLDTIATPAAIVAGTLVTASFLGGLDPMLRWGTALMAGGGAATATQLFTVTTRAASTATTGGAGNPIVSTAEAGTSLLLTILAIVLPILAAALVLLAVVWVARKLLWGRRRQHDATPPITGNPVT
jgi:hypothetical protein